MTPAEFVDKNAPGLIEAIYPRKYQGLAGYPELLDISYRLCIPIVTMSVIARNTDGTVHQNMLDSYATVFKLGAQSVPTFLVTESLFSELLTIEFSQETRLQDLSWPFDGMLFVFPTGLLNSPHEGDCPFIATTKFSANETIGIPNSDFPQVVFERPSFTVLTCPVNLDDPPLFTGRVNFETHPTLGHLKNEYLGQLNYNMFEKEVSPARFGFIAKTESEFTSFLIEFTIKLLLYMSTHPEKITKGVILRKQKEGKKRVRELRTPNIIA